MKTAAESAAKVDKVIVATQALSGTLQPEAESGFQVVEVAKKEYRKVKETFFNEPEDLRELKKGSALHQKVNPVLADSP